MAQNNKSTASSKTKQEEEKKQNNKQQKKEVNSQQELKENEKEEKGQVNKQQKKQVRQRSSGEIHESRLKQFEQELLDFKDKYEKAKEKSEKIISEECKDYEEKIFLIEKDVEKIKQDQISDKDELDRVISSISNKKKELKEIESEIALLIQKRRRMVSTLSESNLTIDIKNSEKNKLKNKIEYLKGSYNINDFDNISKTKKSELEQYLAIKENFKGQKAMLELQINRIKAELSLEK